MTTVLIGPKGIAVEFFMMGNRTIPECSISELIIRRDA